MLIVHGVASLHQTLTNIYKTLLREISTRTGSNWCYGDVEQSCEVGQCSHVNGQRTLKDPFCWSSKLLPLIQKLAIPRETVNGCSDCDTGTAK